MKSGNCSHLSCRHDLLFHLRQTCKMARPNQNMASKKFVDVMSSLQLAATGPLQGPDFLSLVRDAGLAKGTLLWSRVLPPIDRDCVGLINGFQIEV